MNMEEIYPSSVEVKYNYLVVNEEYISTIAILKYDTNIQMFETLHDLKDFGKIDIAFHVERKNNADFLKELTLVISKSDSEKKSVSKNQVDINVIDDVKQNAINLRKKIQVENEQIYLLSTYLTIKDNDLKRLLEKTRQVINTLYAKKIIARSCNFRQKEGYIASLPLKINPKLIKNSADIIFTSKGITNFFPFFNEEAFDENGVILGLTNNNLCAIDVFSENNNNYNSCVFGTSGAGKSYFVKLMLLRQAYKGMNQIVIDPEGEYEELVKKIGGRVITINNFNPFIIPESMVINNEYFFEEKINNLVFILSNYFNISNNGSDFIKECVLKTYAKYNINSDKNSLYIKEDEEKIFLNPKYRDNFPSLKEFISVFNEYCLEKERANLIIKEEKMDNTNKDTNEYTSEYASYNGINTICFSFKGKTQSEIERLTKCFIPCIYELIKPKTLIYFDEVFRLLAFSKDDYVISNIYDMFKTLRKKKAGIVAISQDIEDIFSKDNGNFGKSILNNSNMKVLFKMNWEDLDVFEKLRFTKEKLDLVRNLERGEGIVTVSNSSFSLKVVASEFENNLIEGKYEK